MPCPKTAQTYLLGQGGSRLRCHRKRILLDSTGTNGGPTRRSGSERNSTKRSSSDSVKFMTWRSRRGPTQINSRKNSIRSRVAGIAMWQPSMPLCQICTRRWSAQPGRPALLVERAKRFAATNSVRPQCTRRNGALSHTAQARGGEIGIFLLGNCCATHASAPIANTEPLCGPFALMRAGSA